MSLTLTIEVAVPWQPVGRCGRKELTRGGEKPALPSGRVPRVARLMALALRLEELVRTGQVASYSALASLGQVTRAHLPDYEFAAFSAGHSGSVAVSATNRTRTRSDPPGRSAADRRHARLAQATSPVAATASYLRHASFGWLLTRWVSVSIRLFTEA